MLLFTFTYALQTCVLFLETEAVQSSRHAYHFGYCV